MRYNTTKRDPIKNSFIMPNEIFRLGLSEGAIAVYAYLLYCEDRGTYQCYPSYTTIAGAVGKSKNSIRKYVAELVTKRLIETEHTTVIRSSTVDSYRNHIENHIKPHLGDRVITQITTADVQKMYNTVKASGRIRDGQSLSDSMVRSIHMILHEALEDAVRENLIPQNPTNGTTIPKKNYREKSVLTEAQIEKLLDILQDDPYWHDFFYTELMTGMRRGEICGLRWEDFDKSTGLLHIQRTIRYDHGKLHIGETKTNEGNRKIILPQSVAEILSNKRKYALTEWIFPNPIKPEEPLHPESAYGKLQRTLAQANLPQVSFHELRHTFSTRAASNGIDPKTLAGILGHTNASFTLDTYTHVTTEMQKNASNIVGNFITDMFGEELKPWQSEENPAKVP